MGTISRVSDPHYFGYLLHLSSVDDIIQESHHDNEFSVLIEELYDNPNCKGKYSYIDIHGILCYKGCVTMVSSSTWCAKLLHEFHAILLVANLFFFVPISVVNEIFIGMVWNTQLKHTLLNATFVNVIKSEAIAPPGLLQPLHIPKDVWINISMGFIWVAILYS